MGDEAERELERAAQRGDLEAEAELLKRHLRTRSLSRRALGQAAALGHEPSRLALGLEEPAREDWIGLLHPLPLSGVVRAALVALEATGSRGPGWELAAAWAREPGAGRHAAARAEFERGALATPELTLLAGLTRSDRGRLGSLVEDLAPEVPDLRARVRAALVPWLLGRGDPLRPTAGGGGGGPRPGARRDPPGAGEGS